MKRRQALVLLLGLLVMAAPVSARKWTSSDGQFSVEAELVEAKGGNVRLKRQDGKVITVPVSKLSKADQDYLSSIATAAKTPDAATVKKLMAPAQLALGDPVVNSVGMVMVPIPAGEFQMGSPESDIGDSLLRPKPQHLVKITKPFYLSVYEVTQQQYEKVMGTRPWQGKTFVKEGPDYPAVYVSWDDAVEFCRKLSQQEGVEYRLPTEAEWEYACRAGTTTAYSFGDDASKLGQYGWYNKNAWDIGEKYAHRVGRKLPNPWGLYDMHGNVFEWCQDRYAPYGSEKVVSDPMGPSRGEYRLLRGGAFNNLPSSVRSEARDHTLPPDDGSLLIFGFRTAMSPSAPPDTVDDTPAQVADAKVIAAIEKLGGKIEVDENKAVVSVALGNTNITDAGLVHLKGLTKLERLRLEGTKVTDAGLVHLKGMTKLWNLHLEGTQVTDYGLTHLKGLTSLTELWLGNTKVTDVGLVHLQGMTNLASLQLEDTNITDAGLKHLKGLTSLKELWLGDTNVTDFGLPHLKGLTKLESLGLGGPQVTDAGLEHLKGLTNLEVLNLTRTKITDAGLVHLKGLTGLLFLYLNRTKVTDAGVEKLQQALPKCKIRH